MEELIMRHDMYAPIGYWLDCDTAVCTSHYEPDKWLGFETWDEPIAIFATDESDTPTHCSVCEALIEHELTPDGYAYVTEAFLEQMADESFGRKCIVRAWVEQYLDNDEAVDDWPVRDEYSPGGPCVPNRSERD